MITFYRGQHKQIPTGEKKISGIPKIVYDLFTKCDDTGQYNFVIE